MRSPEALRGCLVSVALGFIGALIGTWLAHRFKLPAFFVVNVDGQNFPVLWSIIGAALFVAVIHLISATPEPRAARRRCQPADLRLPGQPRELWRLFDCLENTAASVSRGLPQAHIPRRDDPALNDDHHWSRERIAAWVAPDPLPAPPS